MMDFADFIASFDAERFRTQYNGQRPLHIRAVLYLPRGQYHDALTGSQVSLHVIFGVAPATGLALFKRLESVLTRESEFRAYLPDARKAQVPRRDRGFAVVFDGGEIALGTTNPTVEWMLKQRLFSLEDAITRQPGVDRSELRGDLDKLVKAGVIAETEMR